MFALASSANPDVSNWDVSQVTDVSFMFYEATSANPDVWNWDVSSVTDMSKCSTLPSQPTQMFRIYEVCTDMSNMFHAAVQPTQMF